MRRPLRTLLAATFLTAMSIGSQAQKNDLTWLDNASEFRDQIGQQFGFVCPALGDLVMGLVWGTDIYTDDSAICAAAVHAGVIAASVGGAVAIEILEGQESYLGTVRNGVTSADWPVWLGSFRFVGLGNVVAPIEAAAVAADAAAAIGEGAPGAEAPAGAGPVEPGPVLPADAAPGLAAAGEVYPLTADIVDYWVTSYDNIIALGETIAAQNNLDLGAGQDPMAAFIMLGFATGATAQLDAAVAEYMFDSFSQWIEVTTSIIFVYTILQAPEDQQQLMLGLFQQTPENLAAVAANYEGVERVLDGL